jgi:hypothetical protein
MILNVLHRDRKRVNYRIKEYFSQFDWIGSGGDDLANLGFCWTEICGQEKLTCWRFLYSWTCVTMLPPHFTCTHHSGNLLLLSAAFLLTTFRCFYAVDIFISLRSLSEYQKWNSGITNFLTLIYQYLVQC